MWRMLFVKTLLLCGGSKAFNFVSQWHVRFFTLGFLSYLLLVKLGSWLCPFALQKIPHSRAEKLTSSFFPCGYFMPTKPYKQNVNSSTNEKMSSQIMNYLYLIIAYVTPYSRSQENLHTL